MNPIQLVLISGISGAGKTTALHTLEDLGFYCADNLPVVLIPQFLDILLTRTSRIALGLDIRDALFLPQTPDVLRKLHARGFAPELIFLDAQNTVLKRRFKETRRAHPLDTEGDLNNAIERERRTLRILDPFIHTYIDTSERSPHQLRDFLKARYASQPHPLSISIISFGFKKGLPSDADLIFDARFLKNPFFVPELSSLTGRDQPVADYVFSDPNAHEFLNKIKNLLDFLIPLYQKEGKRYLTIAIGCTGGQHRSVALSEAIFAPHAHESHWHLCHRELANH